MEKGTKIKSSLTDYIFKWIFLCWAVGIATGSASALFLTALDAATDYRESHPTIIWLLPLAGLLIGLSYHHWGKNVVRGNNQLIDEYKNPKKKIPFIMAPLVLMGTLLTHLFGGSAGREGTAVQMGGAIADQFSTWKTITPTDRKILLVIGLSAGFASVFGTPVAGVLFSLEVLIVNRLLIKALLPAIATAFLADYICTWWNVAHTSYPQIIAPELNLSTLGWTVLAGIIFGITALIFTRSTVFFKSLFNHIAHAPLRPLVGGTVLALTVYFIASTKYIGLGIPTIESAFTQDLPAYDFLVKILFTAFTLGAGFKGGEVTPLFFVGATLGNALVWWIPLPVEVLAGMGFVAVFSGATHSPLASTVMGMELFGIEAGVFLAIVCTLAYFFSGSRGIYSTQQISYPKEKIYAYLFSNKRRNEQTPPSSQQGKSSS